MRQAQEQLARATRLRPLLTYALPYFAVQTLVLPLLATHFTFAEIGQHLHLSQHTVKTQAMSIYRKLGVSSRSQAVQQLQETGVLAG